MNAATKSFISSTYWTERIGPAAVIATIKKMKEKNVSARLIKIGNKITKFWFESAKENGLKIHPGDVKSRLSRMEISICFLCS